MTTREQPIALPGLEGRAALVTGGSRGIGRAAAILLAAAGARVGIAYRSREEAAAEALNRIREAARRSGHEARGWAVAADLSTEAGVEATFRRADEEFGGELHIFVGAAGVWNADPVDAVRMESPAWLRMIDENLTSAFLTTRAAAARMGRGGRIVLISSTAAQRGEAGHSHYAASKGAIQAFVKSVAVELAPAGIAINAVAPGWVDTEMTARVLRGEGRDAIERQIPLGRVASPEDVAGPVAFLASGLAGHITGEILNVNGGSVLCG